MGCPQCFFMGEILLKAKSRIKKLTMNCFSWVPVAKSVKESVKNCQKSTFGFQQVLRNREG